MNKFVSWILLLGTVMSASCQNSKSSDGEAITVSVNPTFLALKAGGKGSLTATVFHSLDNSVVWTSSNTAVATVDSNGVVTSVGTGTAMITVKSTAEDSAKAVSKVISGLQKMSIGANFWNSGWQPGDTYFKTSVDAKDFSSATFDPKTGLMSLNPWRPELLADLAIINGPIRFMDIGSTNSGSIIHWSDRTLATEDQHGSVSKKVTISTTEPTGHPLRANAQLMSYYGTRTEADRPQWAYEWMIDLCNRTGRDMWINVPAFADAQYVTEMAKLINSRLRSDLRVWVEYSNEYWNWISVAYQYSMDESIYSEFIPLSPKANKWYWSMQWCLSQSIKAWKGFYDVFGPANTGYGKRLIRVLAGSSNSDLYDNAIKTVLYNGKPGTFNKTYNVDGMVADVLACAPYIGPYDDAAIRAKSVPDNTKLDGAAPDIAVRYRANVDYNMASYLPPWIKLAATLGVKLVTYEGGSQLDTHAGVWAKNAAIQEEYAYHLAQLDAAGVVLMTHYTWTGAYDDGSAWGLRSLTGDSDDSSPKWRAIRSWLNGK